MLPLVEEQFGDQVEAAAQRQFRQERMVARCIILFRECLAEDVGPQEAVGGQAGPISGEHDFEPLTRPCRSSIVSVRESRLVTVGIDVHRRRIAVDDVGSSVHLLD